MAYASYLYRDRHRTYYLRYSPARLFLLKKSSLPQAGAEMPPTLVRLSLGTKLRPVAQMLARALVAAIEDHIMTSPLPATYSSIQALIRAKLPELRLRYQLEQAEAANMETLDRLIETRRQQLKVEVKCRTLAKHLHEAHGAQKALKSALEPFISAGAPIRATASKSAPNVSLGEVVEEFIKEHQQTWSPATLKKNTPILRTMTQIMGPTLQLSSLTFEETRAWKKEVLTLPASLHSSANRGKSIEVLRQQPSYRCISPKTQQDHFVLAAQFGKWAKKNGYIHENCFEGLKPKHKKASLIDRSFDEARLIKLFGSQNELYGSREHVIKARNSADHHFWIPLLAVFTGGRINELCQLHVDDIQERDGVWGISINDSSSDKRVKAAASRRFVPLHSYIIKAGILKYVENLKAKKESRLFPALSHRECGGYSTQISAWCSEFFTRCGAKDDSYIHSCHSLRHTLINKLKQLGVAESYITEIAGHEHASLALSRYSSGYSPALLKPIIELVSYDFMRENAITYSGWKRNRKQLAK